MRKIAMLLAVLSAAIVSAWAQPNGVTVSLELGQDQYLPDEDMQLRVRIVNRSGQPVLLGTDNQWITFEVVSEQANTARKLGEMPVKDPFTLLSGQAVTREFNPTPYFGFRSPGRYRIGAVVKMAQWNQQLACKSAWFTVSEGAPLPGLGNLTVGVPPPAGVSNRPPEIRRYSLLRVSWLAELRLYFRLTDGGGHTLRVFPLARMLSFSDPKVQIDHANHLHVLFQTGAHTYTYCVLDPNGSLVARQFYQFAQSRPALLASDEGQIFVAGGQRLVTVSDIPAPAAGTPGSP